MPDLTGCQQRVLAALISLKAIQDRAPTLEEIARAAGFRAKSSAHKYVRELEQMGIINRDYRATEIIGLGSKR